MALYVLSASPTLPGVTIEARALYKWSLYMDERLRELEQQFGPPRRLSEQHRSTWQRRRPKPR